MIHLDKSLSSDSIILNLAGLTDVVNPTYILSIKSEYTNKNFNITLGTDESEYPDSYNRFNITMSVFEDYEVGLYAYDILVGSEVIDSGYMRLYTSIADEYTTPQPISLPVSDTDDDYVAYQIENS